jgi:hypothetical protein
MGIRVETKKILERYAYFYDALGKLGCFPLSVSPTIEELGIRKSMVQAAYRDMGELNFEDGVINYLCFISTNYILLEWEKGIIKPERYKTKTNKPKDEKDVYLKVLMDILFKEALNSLNTTRLFFRNPNYFIESEMFKKYIENSIKIHKNKNKEEVEILCIMTISGVFQLFFTIFYLEEKKYDSEMSAAIFSKIMEKTIHE